MKVSDYIAEKLRNFDIEQTFMITGGGAMHLNDSISHVEGMRVMYCHHEQACAIAAEGYYRSTGKVACVNVTTGPGGLNTLTGVMGQWTDSIPVVYISGQVKFETTISSCPELGLRQLGDQEIDIVSVVKPLIKYAVQISDPAKIRYELEKAFDIATSARMGPVWIDVPMNIQSANIDEKLLDSFTPEYQNKKDLSREIKEAVHLLWEASRPLVILGHGIRLASAICEMKEFLETSGMPAVTTFNGYDLVSDNDHHFVGRIGTVGTRGGNFALQNSDVVLAIGSRNNIRQVSYNWNNFAHRAKLIAVDIDNAELHKPTIHPALPLNMDVKDFLAQITPLLKGMSDNKNRAKWLEWCIQRRSMYPVVQSEHLNDSNGINPYAFFERFTRDIQSGEIAVAGNGTACVGLFQAGIVNDGTRYFWNSGCASMGYDLPAAIGAASARTKVVYCFAGDGSLQMNIQELQTVVTNHLPIKLIYLNNNGYISIKQTQDSFFGRRAGCDSASGLGLPDMGKLAVAYGIPYYAVNRLDEITSLHDKLAAIDGPAICEIFLQREYIFMPKLSSEKLPDGSMISKPLEDMYPFLPREEFRSNMLMSDSEI